MRYLRTLAQLTLLDRLFVESGSDQIWSGNPCHVVGVRGVLVKDPIVAFSERFLVERALSVVHDSTTSNGTEKRFRCITTSPSAGITCPPSEPATRDCLPVPNQAESDFRVPSALQDDEEFIWNDDEQPVVNYAQLGDRLARSGDLFRHSGYGNGLIMAPVPPDNAALPIQTGADLAPVIADRVRVRVLRKGECISLAVPSRHLAIMLRNEAFLQRFLPLDEVCSSPRYQSGFRLTRPGYNCGPAGQRILYMGTEAEIETDFTAVHAFLDTMAFATPSDRTNALAAKLTVMLRNFWPGAKPLILVTSTKSHGGKDTVIHFAAGTTPRESISYDATDWALQSALVAALASHPQTGLITVENCRLERPGSSIRSAFLERFLTDSRPLLYSTQRSRATARLNDIVVALSTNDCSVGADLLNRALPIHLCPVGDIATRMSPIGNPKLEFLPRNARRLEAECRGMIKNWLEAGCPLDNIVQHPMGEWAANVGGILQVNRFHGFLENYALRTTEDDPVRYALGILGAARPAEWLRPGEWARLSVRHGVCNQLLPPTERTGEHAQERGMGRLLTAHDQETFVVDTELERFTLQLERARRRFAPCQEAHVRYRFKILDRQLLPEAGSAEASG